MKTNQKRTEIEGIWWLSSKPDYQLAGKLHYYDGDFIKLELIGSLFDLFDKEFKNEDAFTIHGINIGGKPITLLNCIEENHQINFPGIETHKISSNSMFIGAHFKNESDLIFKSASFRIDNLEEWVNISGFKINSDYQQSKINFEYQLPKPEKIYSNRKFDIWIDFFTKEYKISKKCLNKFDLEQYVELRIDFSANTHINEILELLNIIIRFLTLVITKPVEIKTISLVSNTNEFALERYNKFKDKIDYINSHVKCYLNENTIKCYDMIFSYPAIKNKFQEVLNKWFLSYENLEPVFNLFFATIFNSKLYTNDIFLNLIRAIESYHRRVYDINEISKEECAKRIKELIEIKPEYKEWLNIRLKYAFELTLRKRLKKLFSEFDNLFNDYISDSKIFSDRLTDTRNYYTHFDENLKQNCFHGLELYYAGLKLKILLIACFLKELGFNIDEIDKMIKENRTYGFELSNHKF